MIKEMKQSEEKTNSTKKSIMRKKKSTWSESQWET